MERRKRKVKVKRNYFQKSPVVRKDETDIQAPFELKIPNSRIKSSLENPEVLNIPGNHKSAFDFNCFSDNKIVDENRRLWKQVAELKKKLRKQESENLPLPQKGKYKVGTLIEKEIKLDDKLKELEQEQYEEVFDQRDRLIDITSGMNNLHAPMAGEWLERTISASLQTTSSKDLEIELLRQQIHGLRSELLKAKDKVKELQNKLNSEDEINKILNCSFATSEHNAMSFYGIQTRDAKNSVIARNVTYMKEHKYPLEIMDNPDKLQEELKHCQDENQSLKKEFEQLQEKYQKINKRSKKLFTLNQKLMVSIKAQNDFDKAKRDK